MVRRNGLHVIRRANPKRDAFDSKCYGAVHNAGEPLVAKAAAKRIDADWLEVRRVLDRLERQKALSRKRVRGTWHYYV